MRHYQADGYPVSLVCVAALADSDLLEQWEVHLLPLAHAGMVTVWSEHHLAAGANRKEELFSHLELATCIVFLLSADFFASDECLTLMQQALKRKLEQSVIIIPLLVRPVAWQDSLLSAHSCLPANGVPITIWEHPDEGWLSAVQGVRRLLGRTLPISSQPPPLSKRAATDRERMLRLLYRTYQTLLQGSLQGIAWMELGLAEHPDAVRNATHLLQRLPDRMERLIPGGTALLSVYDQAEEQLLILGAPGTGKSTLLLHLALDLLTRAEVGPTHPLPVIVPLSSWAVHQLQLTEWLVEQLARIYDVPRKLGKQWIEQGQILPLLDGLDEMEEGARPRCIATINAYHAEQMTPLVVASRATEYRVAAMREQLLLQNAVEVQPLSKSHITDILQEGGEALSSLYDAFVEQPQVQNLAATPLMLSVLILAYRGITIDDLPTTQAALEARVWGDYVERMVRTKGADRKRHTAILKKRYPPKETTSWLIWLAQQMRAHNQTLFYGNICTAIGFQ